MHENDARYTKIYYICYMYHVLIPNCVTCALVIVNDVIMHVHRIMGRHVQRVRDKVRENGGEGGIEQGLCPFTLELLKEDRSMFEVLMQDDRVTTELAVNLIMALFRTGIDSVSLDHHSQYNALVLILLKMVMCNALVKRTVIIY